MQQPPARHRCMIYEGSPSRHLPWIATEMMHQLEAGRRCLYLNSPAFLRSIEASLATEGLDVASEIRRGRLILRSDQTHLREGQFDSTRMLHMLQDVLAAAKGDGYPGVWIVGDMGWEFGDHANFQELLKYERALEVAFQQNPELNGVCLYHRDTLPTKSVRDALCAHQSVYLNETLFRANPYYERDVTPTNSIPTDIRDLLERFQQNA